MKNIKTLALGALLLVATTIARPALAQWNAYDALMSNNVYSRGWVNPYNNTLTNAYKWMTPSPTYYSTYSMNFSGSRSSRASRRAARVRAMTKRQRTEMQRFVRYNGTMYQPSKSLDTAGDVAGIFSKNLNTPQSNFKPVMREMWNLYVKQAKAQNAPSTDLARTLAYCISANYYYYSGGTGVPEAQVALLRSKLRESLSEDPKFRAMSGAQKQKMNESLVMLTHFTALGFEVVAKKAPAEKQAQVREGFKTLAGLNLKGILGVAPERVGFDKDGLVIFPA